MLLDWKELPRPLLKIKSMQVSRDWDNLLGGFNKLISITKQLGFKDHKCSKYDQEASANNGLLVFETYRKRHTFSPSFTGHFRFSPLQWECNNNCDTVVLHYEKPHFTIHITVQISPNIYHHRNINIERLQFKLFWRRMDL